MSGMTRVRWIALFFHLPGLRLFAGRGLPEGARLANAVAAALPLLAMGLGAWLVSEHRFLAVVTTGLVGHFAWGYRLQQLIAAEADGAPTAPRR